MTAIFMMLWIVSDSGDHDVGDSSNHDVGDSQRGRGIHDVGNSQ